MAPRSFHPDQGSGEQTFRPLFIAPAPQHPGRRRRRGNTAAAASVTFGEAKEEKDGLWFSPAFPVAHFASHLHPQWQPHHCLENVGFSLPTAH